MNNEIKEKEEYEKYARDHRKELDAQEVKLGDVVTVLVGHFAGEKGVIVGMIACDKSDYADPYYEIEMECDVPEEFRVRKTLIGQSCVIGGVEKRYLKVTKQPSMEIKQGDKVRVSKDAPKLYTEGWSCNWLDCDLYVTKIDGDAAEVTRINDNDEWFYLSIPTKYLIKVEAEAKEAKYKKGERVRHIKTDECGIVLDVEDDGVYVGIAYSLQRRFWKNREIELVQPTEHTEVEKTDSNNFKKEAEEWANTVSNAIKEYGNVMCQTYIDAHTKAYWDAYTADLAKEIAVKVANKYNDPEQAAEYAVRVAKAVVENLKNKQL